MNPFAGAVLAGGASRRMGQDKSLIEVAGKPLVVTAADALREAGADPLCVVGGDAVALTRLGLRVVADEWPGQGPLGGLITALTWSPQPVTVVLACDLPGVNAATVAAIVATLGADDDAAMPAGQHLTAAYRTELATRLRSAFDGGERAVHRAIAGCRVAVVSGLPGADTDDVDTPASLDQVRRLRGST